MYIGLLIFYHIVLHDYNNVIEQEQSPTQKYSLFLQFTRLVFQFSRIFFFIKIRSRIVNGLHLLVKSWRGDGANKSTHSRNTT